MPEVALGPASPVCVGRLNSDFKRQPDIPQKMVRERERVSALHSTGEKSLGSPIAFTPGQHWLLTRVEGGRFEMRPVSAWYTFGKAVGAVDADPEKADKAMTKAEEELKRATRERQQIENRWEKMVQRRGGQGEVEGEGETSAVPSRDLPMKLLQAPDVREAVLAPEIGDDDLGLNASEEMKKRKQLLEKVNREQREDADAPDAAGELLNLKNKDGENAWDFSDAEQNSDDEEHSDYEEVYEGVDPDADQAEEALEVDEEDAPEEGVNLSKHGQQLQALLKQTAQEELQEKSAVDTELRAYGLESDESSEEGGGDAASGAAEDAGASVPPGSVAAPNRKRQRAEAAAAASDASATEAAIPSAPAGTGSQAVAKVTEPPRPAEGKKVAKGKGKRQKLQAASTPSNSAVAPPLATPAPLSQRASSGGAPTPTSASSDIDILRERALACFRARGGRCTLQEAAQALGLQSKTSPLYQPGIQMLRQMADVEKLPGQATVLKLKDQYR